MADSTSLPALEAPSTVEAVSRRLAIILAGGAQPVEDRWSSELEMEERIEIRPLALGTAPPDVWAVDGGQALVADARCLQVYLTRASRVRFRTGSCVLEEDGPLRCHLLGGSEGRRSLAELGLGLAPDTSVDVNLLRDRWEWEAVERCVEDAKAGAIVLVDGDLLPDWRIPGSYLSSILEKAARRGLVVAGVTKHSSLTLSGRPLLPFLEIEAELALGPSSRWWAPVARSRRDVEGSYPEERQSSRARGGPSGFAVFAVRLDPAARFAFRVDLPDRVDAEAALGAIAAVSNDAGFPGYPYPLTIADRLAACPPWLREELHLLLDEQLEARGIDLELRERVFADRHLLMERG